MQGESRAIWAIGHEMRVKNHMQLRIKLNVKSQMKHFRSSLFYGVSLQVKLATKDGIREQHTNLELILLKPQGVVIPHATLLHTRQALPSAR